MRVAFAAAFLAGLFGAPSLAQMPPNAPFQRQGYYTTQDNVPPPMPPQTSGGSLPWQQQPQQPSIAQPPGYVDPNTLDPNSPTYIPFQRATPYGQQAVPSPLPMDRAVPVENIEGIEVTEPAAPAPRVEGANPAEEDPAEPTALTAPLFAADPDTKTPREIVLRVLNKVTARAEAFKARPGTTLQFGKLEIDAVQCYTSLPSSQSDSVALLAIREHVPELKEPKLLFNGWMYASSPSLTALEHPIYDVTMVDCVMKTKPADALDEDKKKPAKGKKKAD